MQPVGYATYAALVVAAVFALAGCSLKHGARGASCVRTAECGRGLACVEGRCGTDLQAIADQSTPADLGVRDAAAAVDGVVDGAVSDAAAADGGVGADAEASSGSDAAMSGDDAG